MSPSLPPPPPEPTPRETTVSTPLRETGNWGLLASSAPEIANLDDRASAELSRRTVAWLLAVLLAIGVGLLTVQIVAPTGSATWLILLGVGVVGFLFLWRKLEWGIIGYLCVAWMVLGTPDVAQGGSGGGQKLLVSQLGLVALLAVWGLRKLFAYDLTLFKSPLNAPIICYLAFAAWSTVHSLLFPDTDVLKHSPETFLPVNILEYALRFLALAGVLLLGNTLTGKHLRFAAVALLVPGIATFTGLLKFVPVTDYQAFAQVLAMAICAAFALTSRVTWQRFLAGGVALTIFGVYFIRNAEWVSGWMGALVALALITWRVNRKIVYGAAALIAVLVVANFPYFWEKVYTSNFYGGRVKRGKRAQDEQGNLSNDRSRMLYASTLYAAKFPLGIGLGNYRAYNMWYGRPENWNTTTFTSAHGTYAQVISETGWGGFALFAWLIYANASLLNRTYKALPPGKWRTYTLGAWGGCIGIYVSSFNGDYFFPAYHNGGLSTFGSCVYTHLVVGIVLAVAREKGFVFDGFNRDYRELEHETVASGLSANRGGEPAK